MRKGLSVNSERSFRIGLKWGWVVLVLALLVLAACGGADSGAQSDDSGADSDAEESGSAAVQSRGVVSATGEVVPEVYTVLSFAQGGQVMQTQVAEGDSVEAGDVLAQLDTANLNSALLQAQAALSSAEANLAKVEAGPLPEEIAAAEAALSAAYARTSAAASSRDQLYSSVTQDQIISAENDLYQAQLRYDNLTQAMADLVHFGETQDMSQFEPGDPNPMAAGENLAYQIELAELQLQASQAYLNDLTNGPTEDQLRVANARIWVASAQAQAAKARLDQLLAGPLEEDILVAEAQVAQAEADVTVAQARIEQAQIIAPFDGVVTDVFIENGEFVAPGQRAIQIAALDTLWIETTDLNEIDAARVVEGASANVTFDALPGEDVQATVVRISPKSVEGAGVNYTIVLALDSLPEAVRWGMTAFVDIEAE